MKYQRRYAREMVNNGFLWTVAWQAALKFYFSSCFSVFKNKNTCFFYNGKINYKCFLKKKNLVEQPISSGWRDQTAVGLPQLSSAGGHSFSAASPYLCRSGCRQLLMRVVPLSIPASEEDTENSISVFHSIKQWSSCPTVTTTFWSCENQRTKSNRSGSTSCRLLPDAGPGLTDRWSLSSCWKWFQAPRRQRLHSTIATPALGLPATGSQQTAGGTAFDVSDARKTITVIKRTWGWKTKLGP